MNPNDERQTEEFLDCRGRSRTFVLGPHAKGLFLEAVELKEGTPTGMRFVLPVSAEGLPPWGPLRDKIRERLSQRHLAKDSDGTIHVLHNVVRAQVTDREDDGTPNLLIDDLELSWRDLGRLLAQYEGCGLRIEIRDCGDE